MVGKDYRYIVAALTEHPQGAQILVRLIGAVEKAMQELHVVANVQIAAGLESLPVVKSHKVLAAQGTALPRESAPGGYQFAENR